MAPPYNLRSHGRVVGEPKPCTKSIVQDQPKPSDGPFAGWIIDDPPSEEERKATREMILNDYIGTNHYPYPSMAMKIYNKNLNEEDHLMVSELGIGLTMYYAKVGYVHLLHFEAHPKSLEKRKSAATTHLVARFHETVGREIHLDEMRVIRDPPKLGESITQYISLCCMQCGYMNEAQLKSGKPSKEAAAQKSEVVGENPDSDYYEGRKPEPCHCHLLAKSLGGQMSGH